jgi:chromosome segregation ATPase
MKGLQTKQREARMLPTIDLCEGLPDGMPSSMVALGQLVQGMAETEETDLSFLRQLAEVVHEVKSDFCSLLSKKEFAESRLNSTVATDEKMGYDLASARERLREARDQLMDSREEADRLRSEVASLREELEKRGTKRTLDDHSEVDEVEGQELDNTGSRSKRLSLDDYHRTTDDV